jgi:membrane associated rhomboid family serine protease
MIPLKDDNPTSHRPWLTVALIAANILTFLYQVSQGTEAQLVVMRFGLIPYELTHGVSITPALHVPASLTVFTSMFLHGGWLHLAGNMLYLWIFGNNIEDRLRPLPFLVFYILSGVVASLLFVATAPGSRLPLVGASGAIAGVLGAYAVAYPRARVLTLIFFGFFVRLVWIPAFVVLGFWFILQLLYSWVGTSHSSQGGIAYMAHVGGFAFGMLVALIFRNRLRNPSHDASDTWS